MIDDEVGLFVVAHCTDCLAFETQLGEVDDRAARSTGNGQSDFIDEFHISAFGNRRNRPAEDVEDVKPDDGDIERTHLNVSRYST